MSITKTLISAVEIIDELEIPYMISGSLAVNFYGIPRLTHDADLIIELPLIKLEPLVAALQKDFYVSLDAASEAQKRRGMFNAIHQETNLKVDFWILKEDEYDKLRFRRRQMHKVKGKNLSFVSPEDLVIVKLAWYQKTDSAKHFDDAIGVLTVQGEKLDFDYLGIWAKKHLVDDLLEKAKDLAKTVI